MRSSCYSIENQPIINSVEVLLNNKHTQIDNVFPSCEMYVTFIT